MDPVVPNPQAPQIPVYNTVQTVPEPPPKKVNVYFVLAGIVLLLSAIVLSIYFLMFLKPGKDESGQNSESDVASLPKYFINCDDARQVLEDKGLLYTACLGGVLVVDSVTGEVRDQIGMPDGLSNSIATSLVKKGDVLFIGTQDGVTVFNLETREAKKISVDEGLVNGSNIQLFEDGDNIWVGTFDGVSLINTNDLSIKNFTSELNPAAEKHNIVNMFVTDTHVYMLEVGSVHSNGAVIRFAKADGSFKTFLPGDFGKTGEFARIDFNTVAVSGSRVFVSGGTEMYMMDESEIWQKVEKPLTDANDMTGQSVSSLNLLQNSDTRGVLMYGSDKIFRYVPESDTTEVVYDFGQYADILFRNSGSSVWYKDFSPSDWLGKLNLSSLSRVTIKLQGRPVGINQIVALIDNQPIVTATGGIYKYDLDSKMFTQMLPTNQEYGADSYEPTVVPIPGTSSLILLRQSCGQGCSEPVFINYDYLEGKYKKLELPEEVNAVTGTSIEGGVSYQPIGISWTDFANGEVGFETMYTPEGETPKMIAFNVNSSEWRVADAFPETALRLSGNQGVYCNKVYTFKDNDNKFTEGVCTGRAENDKYEWTMEDGKVRQVEKEGQVVTYLDPETLPAKYSPFPEVSAPSFGPIMYANGRLWILSDRGLIAYSPEDAFYKVYGPAEGLVSQELIKAFVDKYVWVTTNWGGLSIINE